jgi:mRNA-degrading endonuclease toxin of MazEF toxin-antitoxin module
MSLPLIAHLETSTRHGGDVLRAYLAVKNMSTMDRFELSKGKGGLDEDEVLEIKNRLGLMSEIYTEGLDVPEEITSIWRGSVDYD